MPSRIDGTRRIAALALDPVALAQANAALLELPMTHIYDGVGDYMLCHLWNGAACAEPPPTPELGRHITYLAELVDAVFLPEYVRMVRIFAARRGGYIRPHRDFYKHADPWLRVHIPLQTDPTCLNSEDETVFHMGVGEVWLFDGSRPHSGGAFSNAMRLHLVIDFVPGVDVADLFRETGQCEIGELPASIVRPPLSDADLDAIYGLAAIASPANFMPISDLLGSLHFQRQVSCTATYDWLIEIGRRSGDPRLLRRARKLQDINIRAALADAPQ